jgi:hypothetical protein
MAVLIKWWTRRLVPTALDRGAYVLPHALIMSTSRVKHSGGPFRLSILDVPGAGVRYCERRKTILSISKTQGLGGYEMDLSCIKGGAISPLIYRNLTV